MKVSRTTTIASIKEEITNLYNYATPKEFDLLHHGVSLVNSTLMGHNIGDSAEDTLIVAERIGKQLVTVTIVYVSIFNTKTPFFLKSSIN